METVKTYAAIGLSLLAMACASDSPVAPTPPAPSTWNLAGTVTGPQGALVATLTILDGANAGRTASSTLGGQYAFSGLAAGGFSLRVIAPPAAALVQPVTLTAHQTLDLRLRAAILAWFGDPTVVPSGGGFAFTAPLRNDGDATAIGVTGTTTFVATGAPPLAETVSWTFGGSVPPAGIATYGGCCLSAAWGGRVGTYTTTFVFQSE